MDNMRLQILSKVAGWQAQPRQDVWGWRLKLLPVANCQYNLIRLYIEHSQFNSSEEALDDMRSEILSKVGVAG